MDYSELLDATIDHLEEQQARGQRYVDVADATLEALNRPVHSPEAPARQQNTERERPGATRPSSRVGFQPAPVPPAEVPKVDLFVYDRSKPLSREEKENAMADLRSRAMQCVKCDQLVRSRQNVVFGVGNIHTDLMFIGEAPGMDEDQAGEPFVGKAGQLLNKVLQTMGLQRENIYIGNVLKCRPDTPGQRYGNRKPTPTEMNTCLPYLQAQIDIIRPKVIVCLGGTAVEGLFGKAQTGIMKLRGNWMTFRDIPTMPTYHPSYLLRNQAITEKRKLWEDMLQVMERLEISVTDKHRGFFLKG